MTKPWLYAKAGTTGSATQLMAACAPLLFAIAGLCAMGLIVLPTALLIARHGGKDRRELPVVESRSEYRALIDQARYEQAAAQAARAKLAAGREGAR